MTPIVACCNSCATLSSNANFNCDAPILAKKLSDDSGPFDPIGSSWNTMLNVG